MLGIGLGVAFLLSDTKIGQSFSLCVTFYKVYSPPSWQLSAKNHHFQNGKKQFRIKLFNTLKYLQMHGLEKT